MSRRVVAVHQPNFFPWLGFFDKIARSDVFIVLDHVQFPNSKGNWSNRVRLVVGGEARWVTMPVDRHYQGLRSINEIQIDDRSPWRRKLLQSLRMNYGRAVAFREVFPHVETWVEHPTASLADYNLHAIEAICARLGLPASHLMRSSTLGVAGSSTDLLVNLVRQVGGTVYLSGDGSDGYLDAATCAAAGVALEFQQFAHPNYSQRAGAPFVRGLSVLDALFHLGFDGTAALFAQSRPETGR